MTVSVVVVARGGSRALVRTTEHARRTRAVTDLFIASRGATLDPIVESLAIRLGATAIPSASLAAAVNTAAERSTQECVIVLPAGCRFASGSLEGLVSALERTGVAAAAPSIAMQSGDGLRTAPATIVDSSVSGLLARPELGPRVLALTRTSWIRQDGLDADAGSLALYELALRLAFDNALDAVGGALVLCDTGAARWPALGDTDNSWLEDYRYLLGKHQDRITLEIAETLVRRELEFGTLRETHRALIARRDADLQHLDGLRARSAHARAWLSHRGFENPDWGDLKRTGPVSRDWGYDRGGPVDRHYIESFLASRSSDIRGRVLEVQEDDLSRAFGGPRVERTDIVDLDDGNGRAAIVADLRCAPHVASDTYDCVVLTQTLHVIDDMPAVIAEVRRMLKPSGVVLATMPCASRVCVEYGEEGDLWRVTPAGARRLFEDAFGAGAVETTSYGNVLSNVAFLEGFGRTELDERELDAADPFFPAVVGIRARKTPAARRVRRVVLMYHRVSADDDIHRLAIAPEQFQAQLRWLRGACTVLPLHDLLSADTAGLPRRAVAITFDDGYLDNVECAAPLLESAGVPATFFVTTRWLDEPGEYWWDLLARVLGPAASPPPVLRFDPPGGPFEIAIGAEPAAAHRTLHGFLVNARPADRDHLVATLARHAAPPPAGRRPMMADEVRQLAARPGMSVGAHSVNHLSLAAQSPDVVREEIEACRAALEHVLGVRVNDFAYPYGAASGVVRDVVRRQFRWGCACAERAAGESFDAAWVPRVDAGVLDVAGLEARLGELFGDLERPSFAF